MFLNFCIELSSVKKCSLSEELTGYSESERTKKTIFKHPENCKCCPRVTFYSTGTVLMLGKGSQNKAENIQKNIFPVLRENNNYSN